MRLDCNHPLKIRLQLFLVTLSSFILEKELPYNEDYHKKKKKIDTFCFPTESVGFLMLFP